MARTPRAIKPLAESTQRRLGLKAPASLYCDIAYSAREMQLRGQVKSGKFAPFLVDEDREKLKQLQEEHVAYRQIMRERGLIR